MADTINLSGAINVGPADVSDTTFPTGVNVVSLALRSGERKNAAVNDKGARSLTAAVFTDLRCVGPGEAVTKGTFLYVRSSTAMQIRMTTDDGTGGNVVAIVPIYGPMVIEFDETKFLKLLEGLGTGVIEYLVSGAE